jgi:hypothetical protein
MDVAELHELWRVRDERYAARLVGRTKRFTPLTAFEVDAIRAWRSREIAALPMAHERRQAQATLDAWTPPIQMR